ncbi:MAG TPA: ribosome small subunit-dependent GTPase A [Macromonas sp.]|nr:ribosome small subunit-dependent GTPase A [Macromonas sp.]
MSSALRPGLVVAAHGRHYLVETDSGERLLCHPRGKKAQAVVGDRVWWQPSGDEGCIEKLQDRRNLLYRQDDIRTKSFAANLDQVLVLLGAEPEFSESQLMRALIAARAQGIPCLVVLNKRDIGAAFERGWQRLAPYRAMGEQVLPLSLKTDDGSLAELNRLLDGKITLVLGPSGAGKSTLINRLVPAAQAQTREISTALNSGKHTTTSTTWYWTDGLRQTALIDSPGFQEFGLRHIEATRLAALMPDFAQYLGQCRFYNCTHLHEPGCAVRERIGIEGEGGISEQRHRLYTDLFAELSQTRY